MDEIEGVVNEEPVPRILPPSVAAYHRVVVHPVALRETVPVPHRLPGVEDGVEGLLRTVMGVPAPDPDPTVDGEVPRTRIRYCEPLPVPIRTRQLIGDEDPVPIITVPERKEPEEFES